MDPYRLAAIVSIVVQFALFARWLHRRMRDDEIARAFVRDMATNHLPHIYSALRQIAGHLGLELQQPPPIRWLEINGAEKRRRSW